MAYWRRSLQVLWWKQRKCAYFCYAHPPTHRLQTHRTISRLLDQTWQNFYRIYIESSLRWKSPIRFAILPTVVECQPTAWIRGCQFSPTRATNRLPQQLPLSEPSQLESFVMKPTYPSIFFESLAKINLALYRKQCKRAYFCVCGSIYF